MKIRVEILEDIQEEEVVIKCRALNAEVLELQKRLSDIINMHSRLLVYKKETQFYIPVEDLLFLETSEKAVMAHTVTEYYEARQKMYELEQLLPANFVRISKSAIANTDKIVSIHKNLAGASKVEFTESEKTTYVSRNYYRQLIAKLEEKRLGK